MVKIEQDPIILCDICKNEISKRKHDLHISYGYWEDSGGFTAFHSDQDICDHCFEEMRKTIDTKLETLKSEDEQNIDHWSVDEHLFNYFAQAEKEMTIKYVAEKIDELICNFKNNSVVKEEDSINLTKIRKLARKIQFNNTDIKNDKEFFTRQAEKFKREGDITLKSVNKASKLLREQVTGDITLNYFSECSVCGNRSKFILFEVNDVTHTGYNWNAKDGQFYCENCVVVARKREIIESGDDDQ